MVAIALMVVVSADMMRKSIVFDAKTPKVFYCPQEKPIDMSKMIVKAIPLDKLCEFGPNGLPKKAKSDCYNDIDESEYACAEKQRIEVLMAPIAEPLISSLTTPPNLSITCRYHLSFSAIDGDHSIFIPQSIHCFN